VYLKNYRALHYSKVSPNNLHLVRLKYIYGFQHFFVWIFYFIESFEAKCVKLFSEKLNSIKNIPYHYIAAITISFILSSYKGCVVTQTLKSHCQFEILSSVLLIFNPLSTELNPICYLLALLAHHFLHVSRIRVESLTLRLLMSYIYIWSTYSWCF
jgi:hypothetical protein